MATVDGLSLRDDSESKVRTGHESSEISQDIWNRSFAQIFITSHATNSCDSHEVTCLPLAPHGQIYLTGTLHVRRIRMSDGKDISRPSLFHSP